MGVAFPPDEGVAGGHSPAFVERSGTLWPPREGKSVAGGHSPAFVERDDFRLYIRIRR